MTEDTTALWAFADAIRSSDIPSLDTIKAQHPDIARPTTPLGPWVILAARQSSAETGDGLVAAKADPAAGSKRGGENALGMAATHGQLGNVRI